MEAAGKSISLFKKEITALRDMEDACKGLDVKGINRSELVRVGIAQLNQLTASELVELVKNHRADITNG